MTSRKSGFTLVEVVIVLAIMSIVVAIAAPTWLRQREQSRARACQENLTKIDGALTVYATEFRLSNGASINFPDDLIDPNSTGNTNQGYLRGEPKCPTNGSYTVTKVGVVPECSVGSTLADYPPHALP